MKNKKHLAYFYNPPDNNINYILVSNPLLMNKLCEAFEKVYLISFQNLTFFPPKKKVVDFKFKKHLKIPKNLELFCPTDWKDFSNFMINKSLIAIHGMSTPFKVLKINILLKLYKIKLVQVSNIGNIQGSYKPTKGHVVRGFLEKIRHDYVHNLTVFMSNIGLVKKIEIRFVTDSRMIEYRKKNHTILRLIFNYFNLHFAKELIIVNSRSFDEIKEQRIPITEDKIVLLDAPFNNHQYSNWSGKVDKKKIENHYNQMKIFLKNLSVIFNKEVVICIHPSENLEDAKKNYLNFEVVKGKTRENVFAAFIVLFHGSSSVVDAILLKKKIIALTSNFMDQNQVRECNIYVNSVGMLKLGIDDNIEIKKENFLYKLEKNTENYLDFIKQRINPDGNNIGYEKIINILKERFF